MLDFLASILVILLVSGLIAIVRYAFHMIEVKRAINCKLDELDEKEAEPFCYDYIEKLIFLEEQLGNKVAYEIFEPKWGTGSRIYNIIELQEIAKNIACFLGLNNYCFLVTVAQQRENVAGNIQLNFSENDVFIEVSADAITDIDATVAILAHEITHKYMQLNGIMGGSDALDVHDTEVLTDVACVFLGFGKILLNGYRKEEVNTTPIDNGTSYSVKINKYGYLNKRQLAFVYLLVSTMRKINRDAMLSGLTKRTKKMVCYAQGNYQEYFDKRFHIDTYCDEILSGISGELKKAYDEITKTKEHLSFINEKIVKSVEEDVREKTSTLHSYKEQLVSIYPDGIYDPALKFLKAIKLTDETNKAEKIIKHLVKELRKKGNGLVRLRKFVLKKHIT